MKATYSSDEWDEWLLHKAAGLSPPHFKLNELHPPLEQNGPLTKIKRPPDYGRAAVLIDELGIFDLKGTGVADNMAPKASAYSTGLLTLSEALTETYTQRLLERCLRATSYGTVRHLAVIRLPIFIADPKNPLGMKEPCAIVVREFHPRPINSENYEKNPLLGQFLENCFRAEMELRRFGLTTRIPAHSITVERSEHAVSANSQGHKCHPAISNFVIGICADRKVSLPATFDPINVQLATDIFEPNRYNLVDFNCFRFERKFRNHLLCGYGPVNNRYVIGRTSDHPDYVSKLRKKSTLAKMLSVRDITIDAGDQFSFSGRGKLLNVVCSCASIVFEDTLKIRAFARHLMSNDANRAPYGLPFETSVS